MSAQSMELSESIIIGQHVNPDRTPGTIQWDGNDFIGWNGERWVSLTGGQTSSITDIDGNSYETVGIGSQVWMKENLRVTKYNNGDPIQHVTEIPRWDTLTTPAWAWSDNNASNDNTYGKLYNGHVLGQSKNICPLGWHIPDENDMEELANFLGGDFYAGGKMKETGLDYWKDPNDATNESGFSARGGGYRADDGLFLPLKTVGFFWHTSNQAIRYYDLRHNNIMLDYNESAPSLGYGFSIRCLKD